MKFKDLPKLNNTQALLLILTDGTKLSMGVINQTGGVCSDCLHSTIKEMDNEEESLDCQDIVQSYKIIDLE